MNPQNATKNLPRPARNPRFARGFFYPESQHNEGNARELVVGE